MQITVNDTSLEIDEKLTLQQLLQQQGWQKPGVAVAINQNIISQACWSEQSLCSGDQITLFQAIAGG